MTLAIYRRQYHYSGGLIALRSISQCSKNSNTNREFTPSPIRAPIITRRRLRSTAAAFHQNTSPLHTLYSGHRWSSSSSTYSGDFLDPFVVRHLKRLQIPTPIHEPIVNALTPVYGKPLTVANLQSFGPEALESLSKSIQDSMPDIINENAASVPITISIPHHKTECQLEWKEGISLLQLCKNHPDILGEYMEGTCGGTMSCCTCHVYVSEKMYEALPEPTEAELDMLDLAFQVKSTSRLACQVYVTDEIIKLSENDIKVTIPEDVVDLWA